ncbi:putative purine nucleoside permease [Annulohypoxylon maeteangense]|uniref:putative purine nucleoside permease n=1 Tax=Annulohypoxylon maeteangense TaxID=1927788 RepID=UPI002008D071|nr:putative purine nucleoside permease [Annulohypoxylon maeteangense]KAI0882375.1 putative purine nucleoside permease [Annulohypoxylon maeteangense]
MLLGRIGTMLLSVAPFILLATPSMAAVTLNTATGSPNGIDTREVAEHRHGYGKWSPKVVIVSMFYPEAEVWYDNMKNGSLGDLLANNISVPGLSPLYPHVHCNGNGEICQLTVGESEINAAASMMAFVLSELFDLTKAYFLLAGIAGINPKLGTLGSIALSRFTVQVALQYEIDAREMPGNFSTGYFSYGTYAPDQYPSVIYGTEVMELNENLRDAAADLAQRAKLADSAGAADYRAKYGTDNGLYAAGADEPQVIKCDSATSDVYFSGAMLSETFENTTQLWTNQTTMTYCMTAQEDSSVLHAMMRAAVWGRVDFSRAILMRSGSDFDRPPPSISAFEHLRLIDENGFDIAVQNLYLAGVEIVKGILIEWDSVYQKGIRPSNYIGDIIGTLGGEPDFGSGSLFGGLGFSRSSSADVGLAKRKLAGRKGRNAGGWK